jgi:hypothetical protein
MVARKLTFLVCENARKQTMIASEAFRGELHKNCGRKAPVEFEIFVQLLPEDAH